MLKKLYYWFHKKTSRPDEQYERSAGAWPAKIRDKVFLLCKDRAGNLLDLGCGEGIFISKLLSEKVNVTIYGVDNNESKLIRAQERLNTHHHINIILGDAVRTPFDYGFFNTVVCINFFVNLESDNQAQKIIKEISRVLSPQAKVIFEIRNSLNLLVRLKYKLAPLYDGTANHPLRTYNLKQVNQWLKEAGLKITHTVGIGFPIKLLAPIIIIEAEKC